LIFGLDNKVEIYFKEDVKLIPKAVDFDFLIRGSKGRIGEAVCQQILTSDLNFKSNGVDYGKGSLNLINSNFSPSTLVVIIASGNANNRSSKVDCREETLKLKVFLKYLTNRNFSYVKKKIVFFSSGGSVYGPGLKFKSEDSELNPLTFYAEEKILQELIILDWCRNNGIHPIIMRLANVFNINFTSPKGLVESVINSSLKRSELSIFNSRESTKQYGEVRDYAYWILHTIGEICLQESTNSYQPITINLFPNNIYSIQNIIDIVTDKFRLGNGIFKYNLNSNEAIDSVLLNSVHDFAFRSGDWKTLIKLLD